MFCADNLGAEAMITAWDNRSGTMTSALPACRERTANHAPFVDAGVGEALLLRTQSRT